jgi:hypothetical protein
MEYIDGFIFQYVVYYFKGKAVSTISSSGLSPIRCLAGLNFLGFLAQRTRRKIKKDKNLGDLCVLCVKIIRLPALPFSGYCSSLRLLLS